MIESMHRTDSAEMNIHPHLVSAFCQKMPDIKISYDQMLRAIIYSSMGCHLGYLDQEVEMPFGGPLAICFILGYEARVEHGKHWMKVELPRAKKMNVTIYDMDGNTEKITGASPWGVYNILVKYKHPDRDKAPATHSITNYFYSADIQARLAKEKRNGI